MEPSSWPNALWALRAQGRREERKGEGRKEGEGGGRQEEGRQRLGQEMGVCTTGTKEEKN